MNFLNSNPVSSAIERMTVHSIHAKCGLDCPGSDAGFSQRTSAIRPHQSGAVGPPCAGVKHVRKALYWETSMKTSGLVSLRHSSNSCGLTRDLSQNLHSLRLGPTCVQLKQASPRNRDRRSSRMPRQHLTFSFGSWICDHVYYCLSLTWRSRVLTAGSISVAIAHL